MTNNTGHPLPPAAPLDVDVNVDVEQESQVGAGPDGFNDATGQPRQRRRGRDRRHGGRHHTRVWVSTQSLFTNTP